jgi:hypothetical protein
MSGINLHQLVHLLTKDPSIELEGVALEFLDAFRSDNALQEPDLTQWMVSGRVVRHPREVLSAAFEALAQKWVEDTPAGLRLTAKGLAKRTAVKSAIANTPNEGRL